MPDYREFETPYYFIIQAERPNGKPCDFDTTPIREFESKEEAERALYQNWNAQRGVWCLRRAEGIVEGEGTFSVLVHTLPGDGFTDAMSRAIRGIQ